MDSKIFLRIDYSPKCPNSVFDPPHKNTIEEEKRTRWQRTAQILAKCCDQDSLCFGDGTDDWCCDGEFYCSNNSEKYANEKGGILCPIDLSR